MATAQSREQREPTPTDRSTPPDPATGGVTAAEIPADLRPIDLLVPCKEAARSQTLTKVPCVSDDQLEATARHEAGHAVMRRLLTGKPSALVANADGSGRADPPKKGRGDPIRPEDHLLIALAGCAAESECAGSEAMKALCPEARVTFPPPSAGDYAQMRKPSGPAQEPDDFSLARLLLRECPSLRTYAPALGLVLAPFQWERQRPSEGPVGLEEDVETLTVELDVEDALRQWFNCACEMLLLYVDEVEALTWELQRVGRLSCRSVEAILRSYGVTAWEGR